jgi:hypothetical protein
MAGQRDDAVLGVRLHIAVVRDQRRAVQVRRHAAALVVVPAAGRPDTVVSQVADLGGRMGSVWGGRVTVLV